MVPGASVTAFVTWTQRLTLSRGENRVLSSALRHYQSHSEPLKSPRGAELAAVTVICSRQAPVSAATVTGPACCTQLPALYRTKARPLPRPHPPLCARRSCPPLPPEFASRFSRSLKRGKLLTWQLAEVTVWTWGPECHCPRAQSGHLRYWTGVERVN